MECIIQTVMFRPFTGHDVAVSIVIAVLLGLLRAGIGFRDGLFLADSA